jgi:single-strand DNA-binding protein
MNDLNTVSIVGRLTRDPEIKYTQGGMAILNFSLANGYSKKSGESWKDETNFIDCTYMGKAAEAVSKYMAKGKQLAITGCLRQERWEKDGEKKSKTVILCDMVQLIGSREGGQVQQDSGVRTSAQSSSSDDRFVDDVPF